MIVFDSKNSEQFTEEEHPGSERTVTLATRNICQEQNSYLFSSRHLTWFLLLAIAFCPCLMAGCGDDPAPQRQAKRIKNKKPKKPRKLNNKPFSHRRKRDLRAKRAEQVGGNKTLADFMKGKEDDDAKGDSGKGKTDKGKTGKSKTGKGTTDKSKTGNAKKKTSSGFDDAKLDKVGIRKISGTHLTLYTDVPSSPAVDELPRIFDLAVPIWCEYFGIEPADVAKWRVVGCLVKDKDLFERNGLMSANLPPFTYGFAKRDRIWLYDLEESSDYYRRHLMLHEGTHAIMFTMFERAGASWFKEGIAELMATHYWNDEEEAEENKLSLRYFPDVVEDFPKLGRIKIIQDSVAAGHLVIWPDVLKLQHQDFLKNDAYAWSWAFSAFLDGHPRYQRAFGEIRDSVNKTVDEGFNIMAHHKFEGKVLYMVDDWQIYLAEMEHGYDLERMFIDFTFAPRMEDDKAEVEVRAAAGWQNTGLQLNAGQVYSLTASGRVQLAEEPEVWWSEPNGVSIRYHMGKPRGLLMAVVRPDWESIDRESRFLRPIAIGLGKDLPVKKTGTLFLRINDSPGELYDNDGTYQVIVQRKPKTP